ncbi:MAG: hypothetical protein ACT4P5_23575 [Armatimonadota bacterium]
MMKVLAVIALLSVAQILPSCGGRPGASSGDDGPAPPQVIGWVDEKRQRNWETIPYMIVINHIEHGVPYEFYRDVNIGDLVKYDGNKWTIVRKAGR